TGSSDPNQASNTLTYAWDLDGDGVFGETGAAAANGDETGSRPTFSAAGLDGPTSRTVALLVTDNTGLTSTATVAVNVTNVTPTVSPIQAAVLSVGDSLSRTGSFTDPGPDTWTATVDYGDGSGVQPLALNPDQTFTLSHTYTASGN